MTPERGRGRPVEWALAGLVAVALVPVWLGLLPTQDGPSHVYMAAAALKLERGEAPFADVYEARPGLDTNLLAAQLLTRLQRSAPPWVAERLLQSACLLLFCLGCCLLAGAERERAPPVALLAPGLAASFAFVMGFWSFLLGASLALIAWALAWRDRDGRGATVPLALFALACLAQLAHVAAAGLLVLGVGVLALTHGLDRGEARPAARLLLPIALPALWVALSVFLGPDPEGAVWLPLGERARALVGLRGLVSAPGLQTALAGATALALGAAAVAGARRARAWPWLALGGAVAVLTLVLPDASSRHDYLTDRLTPLVAAALLPLAGRLTARRRLQAAGWALLGLALLGAAVAVGVRQRAALDDYAQVARHVPTGAVVLALEFQPPGAAPRTRPFLHAGSRVALAAGALDAANYEPHTDHFPLRLRRGVLLPHPLQVELQPGTIDLRRPWSPAIDCVVTRGLDAHAARYRGHLELRYREVARSGPVVLFARAEPGRATR